MTEQSFSEKIRRENQWRFYSFVSSIILSLAFVFAFLGLMCDLEIIKSEHFLMLAFVHSMIIMMSGGFTWGMAIARRHDLYVQVRQHSLTQLRRFRGEIDDEIERLESELQEEANITGIEDGKKAIR